MARTWTSTTGTRGHDRTDHAVTRYIERIRPRATPEQARTELEALCAGAHRVRALGYGMEIWRTARPTKLRLRVQPGETPTLMTVLTPFDAYEPTATIRRRSGHATEPSAPVDLSRVLDILSVPRADLARFLRAWAAQLTGDSGARRE